MNPLSEVIKEMIKAEAKEYANTGSYQEWLKLPHSESVFSATMRHYTAAATKCIGEHMPKILEWAGEYYIKCHGGWMLRYQSQIKAPVYTTTELIDLYFKEKV